MGAKRVVRRIFKLLLLDQLLEVLYWVAAVVGLVLLGRGYEENLLLVGAATAVYCVAVTGFYFWVVKRLKRYFESEG